MPFACMAKDGHGPMRFYGATGGRDGEDVLLRNVSQHGQSAPLAGPQLAPCASSGSARWLWAACTPQVGRPATASGARASRLQSCPLTKQVSTIADFHKHVFHSLAGKREPH